METMPKVMKSGRIAERRARAAGQQENQRGVNEGEEQTVSNRERESRVVD